MAVNSVVVNGETILDLRNATATAAQILEGATAYGASGVLLVGTAKSGGRTEVTVSLPADGWIALTQTVSVPGVTASNDVAIAAASDADTWLTCGVQCTAQGTGTLTFSAEWLPLADLTATITIFGIG